MIVSFIYPSTHQRAGGVTMFYEFGNALVHGEATRSTSCTPPGSPNRVERVEQIPFRFDEAVHHHIVDDYRTRPCPTATSSSVPGARARVTRP